MPTYFEFKCKTCGFYTGQAVIVGKPEEEEDKCPQCGSDDCEYKMKF